MSYPSPSSGPGGGGPWQNPQPGYGAPRPQPPYSQPQPDYGQSQSHYGQPPFSPPPYGQPPYGQPPYGQPPYGESKPGTNGFAVAALVLGIAAPLGGFVLSVIFALVAFRQIKRYGQKGVGLAIGGLVATGLWVLIAGVGTTMAVAQRDTPTEPTAAPPTTQATETTPPPETQPPETTEPEQIDANSLRPGDCIQDLDDNEDTVSGLPVVPCAQPHEAEVFATFDVPDAPEWPGEDVVTEQSQQGCSERLDEVAPEAADDPQATVYYLFPTETSWAVGDRKVICMTFYRDGPRTGSIVD